MRRKETALQITSTAENGTKDWTTGCAYIEDIRDGRGYTGGLVGFTTATSDMLHLVRRYEAEHPGNPLVRTCPGCQACADYGETVDDAEYGARGGGTSAVAAHRLGPSFLKAWADAAHRDPLFRKAQRDLRDAMCSRGPSPLRSCGTPAGAQLHEPSTLGRLRPSTGTLLDTTQ